MNTTTSLKYLTIAIDKACGALHPNFRVKLKPNTLLMYNNIRMASCKAFDANKGNPKAIVVATLRQLKTDTQAYVTYVKGLAGDIAFAAHMDINQFEREEREVDPQTFDDGIDTMGEAHDVDDDTPPFDIGESTRAAPRETYAGDKGPEPVAEDLEDAYDAVIAAQAWLSQAFSGMKAEDADFWGVDGLVPFMQNKQTLESGEPTYVSVRDFEEYRELQTAAYKLKRNTVALPLDVEASMLSS